MNQKCPFARDYDGSHATCRSCSISCIQKLNNRLTDTKSKYGNKKVVIDGYIFDSKAEGSHYLKLKLMERAGEISDLQLQVPFELLPKQGKERAVKYISDFVYLDKNGNRVVSDVKGKRTKDYILKRKMMKYFHGIEIREV